MTVEVEPEDVTIEFEAVRVGPIYQHGAVSMDNPDLIRRLDLTDCEFGVQISEDGRVWVCVNGIAFLRFKPTPKVSIEKGQSR